MPKASGDYCLGRLKSNVNRHKPGKDGFRNARVQEALNNPDLEEMMVALEKDDPNIRTDLAKLHTPPRGGAIERNRMVFYLQRAAKTRLDERGHEKQPTASQKKVFNDKMYELFEEMPATHDFSARHFLDDDGNLKMDIFEMMWRDVNKDSSPGFGFAEETNREVGMTKAYEFFNEFLKRWLSTDHASLVSKLSALSTREEKAQYLFDAGLAPPATCFVKGESTKEEKIARLIYGVSLLMNLMGVLIFQSFLAKLVDNWDTHPHKVGLDFTSQDGLQKITKFFDKMFDHIKPLGKRYHVVSDDIQGWEYQVRSWMSATFHASYRDYLDTKEGTFLTDLSLLYDTISQYTLIIDSDCFVHCTPFYIRLSGEKTTHSQNCFERISLSAIDTTTAKANYSTANGDDNIYSKLRSTEHYPSENIGFVHTDTVEQTRLNINFCSQRFYRDSRRDVFKRAPDGVAKMFYNYLATDEPEAHAGIETHLNFVQKSAFSTVYDMVKHLKNKPQAKIVNQSSRDVGLLRLGGPKEELLMKKGNQKKQTPKAAARPRKLQRRPQAETTFPTHYGTEQHNVLCGLTDPFCDHAKGAKVPDIGAAKTFTEQVRYMAVLSSDNLGQLGAQICAKSDKPILSNQLTAPGDPAITTYANGYHPVSIASLIKSSGDVFRVVTYGVKAVSMLSATDSKGSVITAQGRAASPGAAVDFNPDVYTEFETHAVGPSSEWHSIGKPNGSESTDMQDVVSYTQGSIWGVPGWNTIFFLGMGLPPSTACLQVEVTINYEYTFATSTGMQKLQSDQPVFNPSMLSARNEVMLSANHVIKGGKEAASRHFKAEAKKALTKHVLPFIKKKGLAMLT